MDAVTDFALVTGAGSGIGAALAVELSTRGVGVILVGRRREALDQTRASLPAGAPAWVMPADIAEATDREGLVASVTQRLEALGQRLRYLVHNAGIGEPAAGFEAMEPDDLTQALAVNVTAPLALTQQFMPALRQVQDARVLFVGAGIADRPQPGTGSYGISKKALARLFEQLQADFAWAGADDWPALALFQPGLVDTTGLQDHLAAARSCGLPHTGYLDYALTSGQARAPETVARAMADALIAMPVTDFSGATLRP